MESDSLSTIASDILHRAKCGDGDAWDALADLYTPFVYKWCRLAGVPAPDTIDLAQEVFLRTIRFLPQFSRDRQKGESLSGWMFVVTRNLIVDYFRAKNIEPANPISGLLDAVADMNERGDDEHTIGPRMQKFLSALDNVRNDVNKKTWIAFWRMTVDRDDAKSIAKDLQMTPGAVREAKRRVIEKLRREMEDPPP